MLEKGGPKAGGAVNWSAGGAPELDSNAGGPAVKMGPSVPGGISAVCGRSRTVESTRSCGPPFLLASKTPGRRSPGERSEKSESGSLIAAMIFSLATLLMASRPGPAVRASAPTSKCASTSARLRLTLRRTAIR